VKEWTTEVKELANWQLDNLLKQNCAEKKKELETLLFLWILTKKIPFQKLRELTLKKP